MSALLEASGRVRVKVCCISSIAEAQLALDAGADALGLVSAMPSGPGVIADADIERIARWIDDRAARVLLTSRTTAASIAKQLPDALIDVLQLVDDVPDAEIAGLRSLYPAMALMRVIHVRDARSAEEAAHASAGADAILLDSGNPGAAVRELGGTGRVHDWQVSRVIRDAAPVPVFLAGGLRAENVAQAIDVVRPFGVDVCSGVRRDGRLEAGALEAFMTAVRATS